jgi:Rieske Fe-S protein
MADTDQDTRRQWFAKAAMGLGLLLSYGTLAVQGALFILPERLRPKTRLLFAGQIDQYVVGGVQKFVDLEGNEILVKRDEAGFVAYGSRCPHLGCRVNWEPEDKTFFCPCHRGVFDENGLGISGPPADGGQRLSEVPLKVDEAGGVVYIEVRDTKRRKA